MIPFEPQKSLLGSSSGMPVQAGLTGTSQLRNQTTNFPPSSGASLPTPAKIGSSAIGGAVPLFAPQSTSLGSIGGAAIGGASSSVAPSAGDIGSGAIDGADQTVAPAPSAPSTDPYADDITSDPGYAAAQNDATLSAQDAASARTAAIRAAVLQYGGFAPGMTDTYGDVDAATLQAAQANQFSQLAQNQRSYTQGLEKDRQGEAANGSIFSGQVPTDMGNENYNQGLNLSNLANAFGSTINSAIGNYTGVLSTNRTNLANALLTAEQTAAANAAAKQAAAAAAAKAATASAPNPISIPSNVSGSFNFDPSAASNPLGGDQQINDAYINSDLGQQMAAAVESAPGGASSGAAGVLTGNEPVNYQAIKEANDGSGSFVPPITIPNNVSGSFTPPKPVVVPQNKNKYSVARNAI